MTTRDKIKMNLPHGAITQIAEKAGVSKGAVTRFLNGSTKSSVKIERAALEFAIQYKKENSALVNELQNIVD